MAARLVARLLEQRVERGAVAGDAAAFGKEAALLHPAGQGVGAEPGHAADPGLQPRQQDGRGRPREDLVHQRDAEDTKADLLDAGQRGVEDRPWRIDAGEGDQRGGEAGQAEGVAARRRVIERTHGAARDPKRQHQHQQRRRIDQHRHRGDREGAARQGAEEARQRLGTQGAREWLDDDVDRADRPIGPRQVEPERQIQRQHRRREGAGREQPVPPAGKGREQGRASAAPGGRSVDASAARRMHRAGRRLSPGMTPALPRWATAACPGADRPPADWPSFVLARDSRR